MAAGSTIVPEDIQITTNGSTVVVPSTETSTITYHPEQATTIKTDSGPIQIVQIQLPDDTEEQKQWINLLQAQHQG